MNRVKMGGKSWKSSLFVSLQVHAQPSCANWFRFWVGLTLWEVLLYLEKGKMLQLGGYPPRAPWWPLPHAVTVGGALGL